MRIDLKNTMFIYACIFILLIFSVQLWGSDIMLIGTILCDEDNNPSYRKTAQYVIIWQKDSKIHYSNENGLYFLILPYKDIVDKKFTLFGLKKSKTSEREFEIDQFSSHYIGSEMINQNNTIRLDTIFLKGSCDLFENRSIKSAKESLNKYRGYEENLFDLEDISFDDLLSSDITCAGKKMHEFKISNVLVMFGTTIAALKLLSKKRDHTRSYISKTENIHDLFFDKSNNGIIYQYLLTAGSNNIGFDFAPTRENEISLFLNPSSIAFFSDETLDFQLNYSVKKNHEYNCVGNFSFSFPIAKICKCSLEMIGLKNRKPLCVDLENGELFSNSVVNYEYIFGFSIVKQLNANMSIGISTKSYYQHLKIPTNVLTLEYYNNKDWVKSEKIFKTINKNNCSLDVDISTTYKISPSVNIGINFFNLFNSKLLNNGTDKISTRGIGAGISYKVKRLHLGTDLTFFQNENLNAAIGANYIIADDTKISIGYASLFNTFSIGIDYKYFNLSFNRSTKFGISLMGGLSIGF